MRTIETLEEEIGRLLDAHGLTLAVAESATGGLVSARLVNVPGSSSYYLGGVVCYANAVKERTLGVSAEILAGPGSVSEEAALAMAAAVRRLLGTDIGISDTGIAGPGGGTPDKPVGLFYVALAAAGYDEVRRHVFTGDRINNRLDAAEEALQLLAAYLRELPSKDDEGVPNGTGSLPRLAAD